MTVEVGSVIQVDRNEYRQSRNECRQSFTFRHWIDTLKII